MEILFQKGFIFFPLSAILKNMKDTGETQNHYQRKACIFILFLLLLIAVCALWITLGSKKEEGVTADVYQDGVLIESIDLSAVPESYTLTVTGENGCTNVVEVRPGSIGIISADCPDQICVRQGFIGSPLLPITCLPNKLVIQLRGHDAASEDGGTVIPDMIAY